MYRRVLTLASLVSILILVAVGCAQAPQRSPEQQNQGPTYTTLRAEAADNPHPNGCVSCHKKTEEADRSLQAYVKRIEGHPSVKDNTVSGCYNCHEAEKNYELFKEFTRGMHVSHWESEIFYTKSNGRCASCHSVEKNGVAGIKDYPLAGYRNLTGKAGAQPKAKSTPAPAKQQQPQQQQGQEQQPEQREQEPQQEDETQQQPTPGP